MKLNNKQKQLIDLFRIHLQHAKQRDFFDENTWYFNSAVPYYGMLWQYYTQDNTDDNVINTTLEGCYLKSILLYCYYGIDDNVCRVLKNSDLYKNSCADTLHRYTITSFTENIFTNISIGRLVSDGIHTDTIIEAIEHLYSEYHDTDTDTFKSLELLYNILNLYRYTEYYAGELDGEVVLYTD